MQTILFVSVVMVCYTSSLSKILLQRSEAVQSGRRAVVRPVPLLPEDFRPDLYPGLKIPNSKFCEEQVLKPADRYLTLPWWYQHCISYLDKKLDKYRHEKYYLPMYRRILDQVMAFKKRNVA